MTDRTDYWEVTRAATDSDPEGEIICARCLLDADDCCCDSTAVCTCGEIHQ